MKLFKGVLIFIAGMITAVLILVLIAPSNNGKMDGLTMFSEKGDCISKNQFKVFQVLGQDAALAIEKNPRFELIDAYNGITVLFTNDTGKLYYDDEIIKIPAKKCVRQIGVYKYPTKNDGYKTVPVVKID